MTTGSADPIEASLIGSDALPDLARDWSDLAGRAIEPNPFLSPAFGLARLRHLPDGRGARLLLAWSRRGGKRRLAGLSLLVPPRGRHLNPLPILRAAELYAPLSTPLLAPQAPAATVAAMLAALRRAGIAGLALPFLAEDGPAAAALHEAAAREGLPVVLLARHRRALLRSPLSGEAYLRGAIESRRRKEADRQRRRLSELGTLAFSVADAPSEVAPALERFLALEAAGWKGAAGTALAQAEGGAAYIREAAQAGGLRIVTLAQNGRPVAAGLVAIAGRRAFYVKTAYDEALSRFSPGLLLTLDLTAHLLDDPRIDDANSVAAADHPMIDRIWTERLSVASLLVGTRPGGGAAFRLAASVEGRREDAIRLAKALRARRASGVSRRGP